MTRYTDLLLKMMEYEKGCPHRIQHFLKVTSFSEQIGQMENLDEKTYLILRTAAVVHDIGIRPGLEKYDSDAGSYQEAEGPPVARPMLEALGYEKDVIDRVCYLIAHHHTYDNIVGVDYQILVEADFLVNIFEHGMSSEAAKKICQEIFRTESGKKIFSCLYP
jgi:HD superfamily phosphodiesterase